MFQCLPRLTLTAGLVLLGSIWAVHDGSASGFQLKEDSAVGLGSAFAGAGSSASTPSTVFDNPAGMTQLDGFQIQLGTTLIGPSSEFSGSARTAFGQPISGSSGNAGNTALVPHLFATYRINPQFAVGIGISSPFGLATSYPAAWVGRYQADKTDLRTININPSIAYQPVPWLSVGAGVSAMYARSVFATYINSSTVAASILGRPVPLPDGYFNLKGDDWAFGYNFGVLLKPTPDLNIGLTYRSRVQQDFSGNVNYIVPVPLALSPTFANSGGTAKLVLPDTAGLSITQRVNPKLEVGADFAWTNWSQFKNLNVFRSNGTPISSTPERYKNTFFISVGGAYQLTDKLTLRAGTAFDKTPISDAYRTARVPDQDRFWLAGGLSYKVLPATTVDFGYAHIFVRDSTINETSPTRDVLTGTYANSIDIVSLGTRMQF